MTASGRKPWLSSSRNEIGARSPRCSRWRLLPREFIRKSGWHSGEPEFGKLLQGRFGSFVQAKAVFGSSTFKRCPNHCVSSRIAKCGTKANRFLKTAMTDQHDHDLDHEHSELGEMELRVRALQSVLTQKGYIDPEALDVLIDTYQTQVGPRNGARVVARSWVDPQFRDWLLRDATPAIASLGYSGRQGEHMVAVENSAERHNLVVCTLCSCYPWPVLGLPPVWYKSAPYRSRAVKDPRGVLADFGVHLPESTEIRVWDSTAEVRYLVIPQRPAGTGHLNEDELAALITRDAMIGTRLVDAPAAKGAA